MMLHDPWWLFNYFPPLLQYVNNFACFKYLFLCTYKKSIQLRCDYIVMWLYLCMCGLKRWCLFFLKCSVYSQVSPPPSHPRTHFSELPQATKNTDIYSLFFFEQPASMAK